MERDTVSGLDAVDETATTAITRGAGASVPEWWAYAREFPRWYVWQGVAGHYYARVPGSSPPRLVRALSAEELREEIVRAELRRPVPSRSRFRNHCA
ncbi:MAG: hypothetical protein JOY82_06915 [Streptosporangiaceae bacterium]|nr:hypothetical protein [Streptosporangiaceae bacterium]MBV9854244.1 hypothetical protein [Streptosporangiaceae bacterium]